MVAFCCNVVTFFIMPEHDWLEPLDRRIKQTREETEAIRRETAALAALQRLYDQNGDGMKRLADS
jgi:hypothetical protein